VLHSIISQGESAHSVTCSSRLYIYIYSVINETYIVLPAFIDKHYPSYSLMFLVPDRGNSSRYFLVLDCCSRFWQVCVKEEGKEKTGFTVQFGHNEFNRLL